MPTSCSGLLCVPRGLIWFTMRVWRALEWSLLGTVLVETWQLALQDCGSWCALRKPLLCIPQRACSMSVPQIRSSVFRKSYFHSWPSPASFLLPLLQHSKVSQCDFKMIHALWRQRWKFAVVVLLPFTYNSCGKHELKHSGLLSTVTFLFTLMQRANQRVR